MKFNQIDPMAITVMADKLRLVFIGQKARSHQRPTRQGTVLVNPPLCPTCAKMLAPVLEWQVNAIQIDAVRGTVADWSPDGFQRIDAGSLRGLLWLMPISQ